MHIKQVHDFLWFYNMDANRLRNVRKLKFYNQLICIAFYNINMYLTQPVSYCPIQDCKSISDHDWNVIVKHALSCKPGHGRYSYDIPAKDATMFFDSLYKIVGAKFNGKYTSYEELNDTQKVIAILIFATSHIGFFPSKEK